MNTSLLRQIGHVPHSVLATALPRLRPFGLDEAHDVRGAFIAWAMRQHPDRYSTWQEAFNVWTGAQPHQPGHLRFARSRCPDCHGRRLNRRLGTLCTTCMGGTRRLPTVTTLAIYQQAPNAGRGEAQEQPESAKSRPWLPTPGDRIRMTGLMPNDPCPKPVGAEGTVIEISEGVYTCTQIIVRWDDGGSLMVLADDPYEVIGRAE